jgi:MA3 domain
LHSQTQMLKGFDRVEAELEDLKLDYVNAPQLFAKYKARALEEGWLV